MNYDAHILDPFINPAPKAAPRREKPVRLKVFCLECEKPFTTSNPMPECPRCGGTDIDIA